MLRPADRGECAGEIVDNIPLPYYAIVICTTTVYSIHLGHFTPTCRMASSAEIDHSSGTKTCTSTGMALGL